MLRKSQAARSFVATALVGATLLFTAAPSGASGLTTFAAAVHYAAGSAPQAMAVADARGRFGAAEFLSEDEESNDGSENSDESDSWLLDDQDVLDSSEELDWGNV